MFLGLSVGILVFFLDQVVKLWFGTFKPDALVQNQGIIFGSNISLEWLYLIFGLILVLALVIMKKPQGDGKFSLLGLALIIGGIASNLFDHLLRGGILDYFNLGNLFFNLADIAIICGLLIYIFQIYAKNS